MRSDRVIVPSPSLDDDSGFGAISEPLDAQAYIAEFAIEGFVGTVLPRLAGIDDGRVDAIVRKPFQDGVAHELWPAVRSQIGRGPMVADQSRKNLDDPRGTNTASDIDLHAPTLPTIFTDTTPTDRIRVWMISLLRNSTCTCYPAWLRRHRMKSLVCPELPTASVGSSQAPPAAVDNSAPLATRPAPLINLGRLFKQPEPFLGSRF